MTTKRDLRKQVRKLERELDKLREGVERANSYWRSKVGYEAQRADIASREGDRIRRQRMVRVIGEMADLREGEAIIVEGMTDPTAGKQALALVHRDETVGYVIVRQRRGMYAARNGDGFSAAGSLRTVLDAVALFESHTNAEGVIE